MIRRVLSVFFLLCLMNFAYAIDSPVVMVKSTANHVIAELKQNKATLKTNKKVVYRIVNKLVLPKVDVRAMSRSVIKPPVWKRLSRSQKKRFTEQFTKIVVRMYASALAEYTNQRVKFFPLRGGYKDKRRVKVHSRIFRSGVPPINMSYRLIRRGDHWKVYDMSVEGVSLLQSFRSQFANRLTKNHNSFENLISELKRRNQ